jgi:hypothetical protein
MSNGSDVRLSFQEAAQEALTEEATAIADPDASLADDALDDSGPQKVEQSTVESEKEVSVFGDDDLVDDEASKQSVEADLLSFDINGQSMTIAEIRDRIAELEQGDLRRKDYTKKTQELAEEREAHKQAIALWDAIQEDPQGTIRQLYQKLGSAQPVTKAAVKSDQTDIEALVEAKIQERLANDPRLQALETQELTQRIEGAFSAIQNDRDVVLTSADKQYVLEQAQEMGINDLLAVFDILMQRKQLKEKQRDNAARASTVTSGRNSVTTDEEDEELPSTFRGILEQELRRDNMLDTVFNI